MAIGEWTLREEIIDLSKEDQQLKEVHNKLCDYVCSDDFKRDFAENPENIWRRFSEFRGSIALILGMAEESIYRQASEWLSKAAGLQPYEAQGIVRSTPPEGEKERKFTMEKALVVSAGVLAVLLGAREKIIPVEIAIPLISIAIMLPFLDQIKALLSRRQEKEREAEGMERLLENIDREAERLKGSIERAHAAYKYLRDKRGEEEEWFTESRKEQAILMFRREITNWADRVVERCRSHTWQKRGFVISSMSQIIGASTLAKR